MLNLKPKYSIILPAFNEKDSIPLIISKIADVFSGFDQSYEIILVDDHSTDDTSKIIPDLIRRFPKTKYIRLKENYGLSAALAAGYNNCSGEILITMDSDLQYDPKDIPELIEKIGDYDLICGFRQNRCDSVSKRISSRIANFILNKTVRDNAKDAGCIFRVFRRDCLNNMELFDGFHRFLPTLFKIKGYKVAEMKVNHFSRKFGKSKFNIKNRFISVICDILMVRWMKERQIKYTIEEKID